jgi:hypothetical protein
MHRVASRFLLQAFFTNVLAIILVAFIIVLTTVIPVSVLIYWPHNVCNIYAHILIRHRMDRKAGA